MVIDFHTHTFPDRIAKATIESLSKCSGITPYTDGTTTGLKRSMQEGKVDISVILPVVPASSPIMDRDVTLFPLPDSPTIPRVEPSFNSKSTPSTDFTTPLSV